ncbi:MAG TPA: DUF4255 domain-containing protein [Rhizomicrobium sp.]|jgi:hypothetical protein|nr:DUF4255 domain-containing protein [Rhizomicrobium sp.]
MSTPLAIAAVTAVLKDVLNTSMTATDLSSIVGDVKVSAKPPDKLIPATGDEPTALNIFLYQVTPNQGWRNAGLPARDWSGDRTGNPPLALDLHYLLTATAPRDIYPEIIMGFAMQMLHETGVLSRELIAKALDPMAPPSDFIPQLKFAELAEQIEQIRVTPAALTVDDISKLWTGFQGRYRMSVAYIVTVVLIQTLRSTRSSLPVVTRNIAVKPFQQIVIDEITSSTPYALAGSTLSIAGTNLDDPNFQLFIDGVDSTALVTGRSATTVTVKLPAPIGSALRAGVLGVQIEHPVQFAAGVLRTGTQSNLAPIVLHPALALPLPPPSNVTHPVIDGTTYTSATLTLTLDPKVTKQQRVAVLLNGMGANAQAYSFAAPTGNGIVDPNIDTGTVEIGVVDVIPGAYLVRVTVDGAESALGMSGSGTYDAPTVTL